MTVSQVTVKQVPAIRVVGLREQIESFQEQGRLWKTLTDFVATQDTPHAGAGFAIHYNLGAVVGQSGKIDVQVCIPVNDAFSLPAVHVIEGLGLHDLPPLARAASVTLTGACTGLPSAYTTLFAWLSEHDETPNGPTREIYHTYDTDPMSDDYQCEVLAPLPFA